MQDVVAALNRKGLVYSCYFDPSRPAVMDSSHEVRVNYETYLFADEAARGTFAADVVRYCGLLTDPVTKLRFRPSLDSPHIRHGGVTYYFQSGGNYEMFVRDPDAFRLPGYKM